MTIFAPAARHDAATDPRDPMVRLQRFFDSDSVTTLHPRDKSGVLAAIGEVDGVEEFASSSWQSLARGTGSIETDYLGGEIVRIGNTLGVPVGKNAFVMRWCRALAAGDDLAGQIPADPQERLAVLRRVILD